MKVLTGVQPSGTAHLGNLFGAMLPVVELSKQYPDTIIFLADLHALTTVHDAQKLRADSYELAVDLLALGLDPSNCTFFRQSAVAAHAQLAWVLSTLAPMGLLERAHSYKDKLAKGLDASVGLFTYPVLMACDILLYSPTHVPVGKDQQQHLEIARDLAQKFNHHFGETFVLPEAIIAEETGVLPGVDGAKMSKSYGNTIDIFGTPKQLKKQIMSIVTDSLGVEEPKVVAGSTICALHKIFTQQAEHADFCARFAAGGMGYGHAKKELLAVAEQFLTSLRVARADWAGRETEVAALLAVGAVQARAVADAKLAEVFDRVGLS